MDRFVVISLPTKCLWAPLPPSLDQSRDLCVSKFGSTQSCSYLLARQWNDCVVALRFSIVK